MFLSGYFKLNNEFLLILIFFLDLMDRTHKIMTKAYNDSTKEIEAKMQDENFNKKFTNRLTQKIPNVDLRPPMRTVDLG